MSLEFDMTPKIIDIGLGIVYILSRR